MFSHAIFKIAGDLGEPVLVLAICPGGPVVKFFNFWPHKPNTTVVELGPDTHMVPDIYANNSIELNNSVDNWRQLKLNLVFARKKNKMVEGI